jgi:hypothetical protein
MKTLFKTLLWVVSVGFLASSASAQDADFTKLVGKWVVASVEYELPSGPEVSEVTEATKAKLAELNTKENKEGAVKYFELNQCVLEVKKVGESYTVTETYFDPQYGKTNSVNLQIVLPAGSGTMLTPNSKLCPATPAYVSMDSKGNLVLYISEPWNEGVATTLTYKRKK